MKFYLVIQGEVIVVKALLEGKNGPIGDYREAIHPGESFSGIPFQQLRTLAEKKGRLNIRERNT